MSKGLSSVLLILFALLNIPNIFPGPYHWSEPLVFGFYPVQLLTWFIVHLVATLILGWLMFGNSPITPWLKDEE